MRSAQNKGNFIRLAKAEAQTKTIVQLLYFLAGGFIAVFEAGLDTEEIQCELRR